MYYAPQRRALFEHRNFQKYFKNGVFCAFWLRNVLRATAACTFWTSQLPSELSFFFSFWHQNALRAAAACNFWSLLWPDGSAPAALLFGPPEPQNIGRFRGFPTFSRTLIFCLLSLSLLWLFAPLLLHLSIGSLTSKLPLMMVLALMKWWLLTLGESRSSII